MFQLSVTSFLSFLVLHSLFGTLDTLGTLGTHIVNSYPGLSCSKDYLH